MNDAVRLVAEHPGAHVWRWECRLCLARGRYPTTSYKAKVGAKRHRCKIKESADRRQG